MKQDIFKNDQDYWMVAETIRNLYISEGSINTLLDFERVLDEMDLYAFKNWQLGELVEGPDVSRYKVSCTFMWPERLMPDPRGAKRLLPFDCEVNYKKTSMKTPNPQGIFADRLNSLLALQRPYPLAGHGRSPAAC